MPPTVKTGEFVSNERSNFVTIGKKCLFKMKDSVSTLLGLKIMAVEGYRVADIIDKLRQIFNQAR